MTTAISYKAVQFEKENERSFIDSDTIYYPIFRVFSFGIKEDFGHKLIKFKLSRRTAFSTIGTKSNEGVLPNNFIWERLFFLK